MNRGLWWRFLALSVLLSLGLSLLYVLLVREASGGARAAIQRSITLIIARGLEEGPYPETMQRLDRMLGDAYEVPQQMWVVDEQRRVLAQREPGELPADAVLDPAMPVHEVRSSRRGWFSGVQVVSTRLQAPTPVFLVTVNSGLPGRPVARLQAVFFVGTLVAAMLLSLALVTLYLRGRSREARRVIAQLEAGDLEARFAPDRLDALGALMLDFNRMADEIERLVHRLQAAEDARRALLQELGHDLRTPLTSLRTSVDTLSAHGDTMPAEDRRAFLDIVRGELDYFVRLVDDLFFIADLAEPRYRRATEPVDLAELVGSELRALQGRQPDGAPQVEFTAPGLPPGQRSVAGDRMLLARLLRNALDNAVRHARSRVRVALSAEPDTIALAIEDDGPGMTPAQIAAFGQRREQRIQAGASSSLSLGLGSVIIRTIVDLHGGRLSLQGDAAGPDAGGTRLTVRLPRSA